jgi:hypothetical protein
VGSDLFIRDRDSCEIRTRRPGPAVTCADARIGTQAVLERLAIRGTVAVLDRVLGSAARPA